MQNILNQSHNNEISMFINSLKLEMKTKPLKNAQRGKIPLSTIQSFCENKKIILIGNCEKILNVEKGAFIDSFDIVIRMNHGYPTPKNIKNLGTKTDIWCTGIFREIRQREGFNVFKDKAKYFLALSAHVNYNQQKYILNNAYTDSMENYMPLLETLQEKPSTGCMAINFFTKNVAYKSLTIYGFDFFKSKTWYNSTHYIGPHNHLGNEEKFIRQFIDSRKIIYEPF